MSKITRTDGSDTPNDEAQSPMRSVERVIAILGLFADERNGLNTNDISALTDIPKSTCFRLLRCLSDAGLLEKSGPMYGVGNTIMRMAQGGQLYEQLRRAALPHMRRLSRMTGKTVGLSVVNQDNFRICIELVQNANQELRTHTPLRTPLPLHLGATGKVLWAHLPEKRQLQVYRDNAPEIQESWEQVRGLLESIRAVKVFSSTNERIWGACSVAAPILSEQKGLVAVLTISAVQKQFTPEETAVYSEHILKTAQTISMRCE